MGFTQNFWRHIDEQTQLQNEAMIKLIEQPLGSTYPKTLSLAPLPQEDVPSIQDSKQETTLQPTSIPKGNKHQRTGLAIFAMIIITILVVATYLAYYQQPQLEPNQPTKTINLVTPTEEAVRQWLIIDLTNKEVYKPRVFVCIDYAIMLATHADMKNWSMGIVLISGKDSHQQWYNHSINSIYTLNGLVYIEPQTDEMWHLPRYQPMQLGYTYTFSGYPYEATTVTIVEIETIHLNDLDNYEFIRG